MTKIVFGVLYFVGTCFMAHMSIMFAVMNETWLSVQCFALAGLFLVLLYKDGIMAWEE